MKNCRKKTGGEDRKNRWRMLIAAGLFINLSLLLSFFFGEMGVLNAMKVQKVYAKVQTQITSLQNENERLIHQIEALKHDSETIERLARDRLGLVKKGEIVYEFIEEEMP